MKVYNLCCTFDHLFEGWFASEADYQEQQTRQLLMCPLCGDQHITRVPAAPRLNLTSHESATVKRAPQAHVENESGVKQQQFLQHARQWIAQTEDVGERFVEEARRIHYEEVPPRPIRGQATVEQAAELMDEGIGVVPLPDVLKVSLQ